jgi:methylase of polypeptide subunit release factors
VRSALREAGFDERTLCATLGVGSMSDLGSARPERVDRRGVPSRLALLIKLFPFVQAVPRAQVERALEPPFLDALLALDLLRLDESGATRGRYYSPVFFYPVCGLLVVSDRHDRPDGAPFVPPPDVVFPAIYAGTLRFLRLLPLSPAAAALDLGTGTGVGALVLSRHARRVVALDVTARACHFAAFNRRLNACTNVEVVQGDLYGPLEGRTFDRIVTHPPYAPALEDAVIYRDGGETGERLVRGVVAGLPRHLRPGGTCVALCLGVDTRGRRFEERLRDWLGDRQVEFDVIFAVAEERSPEDIVASIAAKAAAEATARGAVPRARARSGGGPAGALEALGATKMVYGALAIHRRAAGGEPRTARTRLSDQTDGAALEWALRWYQRRARPGLVAALPQTRPRLAPWLRVRMTHVVQQGDLVPDDSVLESDRPFAASTRVDPWMAFLLGAFDGQRTVAGVYDDARAREAVPASFRLLDCAELVAMLIERGYLLAGDGDDSPLGIQTGPQDGTLGGG